MEIKSSYINSLGINVNVIYTEGDPLIDLEDKVLQSVHVFCFYGDKMVLVNHPRSGWSPPGGGIESGETYEQAVIREVKEETNMKVISQKLIGFQDVYEPGKIVRQTRSFCIVEPYGEFVSDPDGEIMEIKLIDPKEYKKYFDWGERGDRVMKLAQEFKNQYDSKLNNK